MYSAEQVESVCGKVEDTDVGLRRILKEHGLSPGQFYRTLEANAELAERYTRAKERQAELLAEDIIDIADDSGFDARLNEVGNIVVDGDAIQRARLRVDSRKWIASKLLAKKYGDKLDVTSGGEPIKSYVVVNPETDV